MTTDGMGAWALSMMEPIMKIDFVWENACENPMKIKIRMENICFIMINSFKYKIIYLHQFSNNATSFSKFTISKSFISVMISIVLLISIGIIPIEQFFSHSSSMF